MQRFSILDQLMISSMPVSQSTQESRCIYQILPIYRISKYQSKSNEANDQQLRNLHTHESSLKRLIFTPVPSDEHIVILWLRQIFSATNFDIIGRSQHVVGSCTKGRYAESCNAQDIGCGGNRVPFLWIVSGFEVLLRGGEGEVRCCTSEYLFGHDMRDEHK